MNNEEVHSLYLNLGQNIRKARISKGYNQDTFAQMLKLSRASIVNIEKGRQRPTIHFLYDVSKITNIALTDLLPTISTETDLNPIWKKQIQKKLSNNSISEEKLSNFLIEITTKNSNDDDKKSRK